MLFVPVYMDGAPMGTIAQRRAAFIGWVSIAFTSEAVFRDALAGVQDLIDLNAYDDAALPQNLLLLPPSQTGRQGAASKRITKLELAGNAWTLGWNRTPRFPSLSKIPSAWAAGSTALLSLLLAGLVMKSRHPPGSAPLRAGCRAHQGTGPGVACGRWRQPREVGVPGQHEP